MPIPVLDELSNCDFFTVFKVTRKNGEIQYAFENRLHGIDAVPVYLTESEFAQMIEELKALQQSEAEEYDGESEEEDTNNA